MKNKHHAFILAITALFIGACAHTQTVQPWNLKILVESLQPSVVKVITYDLDGDVANIGSGFFIHSSGTLVTNYHVLEGAYKADIQTIDGSQFPVTSVIAWNQLVDLIKVRIAIPPERVTPVALADQQPDIADRVVVIGSPLGLDQTVSEGIISAVREVATAGNIYQLTAPISPGSSGSPVVNFEGKVVGIVTFQATSGQNLNFAISADALESLTQEAQRPSLTEWTIRNSQQGPALAATLCRSGAQLTIQGEYAEALTFFKKAAETNPNDPKVWYGLGSCYLGLDQRENAIEAYKHPIAVDPDNADAHFILAMYYKTIEQYQDAIPSLLEVIRIDPSNIQARFELGVIYGKLDRTQDEVDTLQNILTFQPNHVPTLVNLGLALGKLGHLDAALTRLRQASVLDPENALIHFNLGIIYRQQHETDAEVQAYTSAIRANPRMVPAHYYLGLAYVEQGKRKLALDQYAVLRDLNLETAYELFDKIYPQNSDNDVY